MMRSLVWHKTNGLLRYCLAHTATKIFPLFVVNEYPKSGGSWVGEMVSDALHIPFPRNRFPLLCSSILHGHMMHAWNMHNILIVWRDGRDVLISQYFHYLFENDRGNARGVKKCRSDLQFADYDDVSGNLIEFMAYVYERKQHPRFSWADFVSKWSDCRRCVHVRYEDLRIRPVDELQRIVSELADCSIDKERCADIVDSHSFKKMSGRKAGDENARSFLRKGVVGDWKNYFTHEARIRFNSYAGSALVKLGYESDDSWVKEPGNKF